MTDNEFRCIIITRKFYVKEYLSYTHVGVRNKENIIEVIYSNVGAAAEIFFQEGDAPKKTLIVFFFSCEIKQKTNKVQKTAI